MPNTLACREKERELNFIAVILKKIKKNLFIFVALFCEDERTDDALRDESSNHFAQAQLSISFHVRLCSNGKIHKEAIMKSINRRSFLRLSLFAPLLGATTSFLSIVWAEAQEKTKKLIDMSQKDKSDTVNNQAVQVAKMYNYNDSAKEAAKLVKAGKIPKPEPRKDAKGKVVPIAEQTCATCQYYQASQSPEGIDGAPCLLIAGGAVLVHKQGWCKMWQFKA